MQDSMKIIFNLAEPTFLQALVGEPWQQQPQVTRGEVSLKNDP